MKYPRLDFGMKLRSFRQQSRYEDISVEELLSVEAVYLVGVYQVVYCCDIILETNTNKYFRIPSGTNPSNTKFGVLAQT
jgi:hypothetical protein